MDFGKLASIRGVDFSLAGDDPRSARSLGGIPRPGRVLRLGLPGWAQKEWVGSLYPKGTPSRDFLARYSSQLGTVELNATHYAIPDLAAVERWRESVAPGFRFSPKVPQAISHQLGSREADALIPPFVEAMRAFGDRRGTTFLQLPPTLGPEGLPALARALDRLTPALRRVAVEFRHPRWFEGRHLIAPAFECLAARDVATVIADVAGRRDVAHASLTAPRAFVRFVGNRAQDSDFARAAAWAARVAAWFAQGLEEADVFIHQPDNVDAPELAAELARDFARHPAAPAVREPDLTGGERQLALF